MMSPASDDKNENSNSSKKRSSKVIQVSNVTPTATREQLYQLFSFLGRIEEMKVYPAETNPLYATMQKKLCYIKYEESSAVGSAQHMTNTVFIDRALICVPVPDGKIPDEDTALKTGGPSWPGQRQLPPNVINQLQHMGDQHVVVTIDPTLSSLGLPAYPSLPANTDASKIEEIRRTIYVGNLPKGEPAEDIMQFFNDNIGEVMYLRMAGAENLPNSYAYIELSNQHTVPTALQNNGIDYKGHKLRIQHSRVAIIKPLVKTQDMAKREVEEAMKKQAVTPGMPGSTTTRQLNLGLQVESGWAQHLAPMSPPRRRRSRTRSPVRRRSRSRDRRRRSRSRDRDRRERRKSRSKDRERRKEKSRERKRRSKSRDKDRKRDKDNKERRRDRDKDEKRDKDKRDKSRRSAEKETKAVEENKIKTEVKTEITTSTKLSASEEDEMALRERLLEKVLIKSEKKGQSEQSRETESVSSSDTPSPSASDRERKRKIKEEPTSDSDDAKRIKKESSRKTKRKRQSVSDSDELSD